MIIQETNHVGEGLDLLITQYKDKPNLAGMLTAYLNQVQELEDVFFDILAIFTDIDSQVGEQLDLIGRIVGQDREGRTDDVYLLWIKARIKVNKSSGIVDELLEILALVAPNNTREYTPYYPASFTIRLVGALLEDAEQIAKLLGEAVGAGINGQLIYSLAADSDTFQFASGDTIETSTTQGFANDAGTTGGQFADAEAML
jgi:hypothetical protein